MQGTARTRLALAATLGLLLALAPAASATDRLVVTQDKPVPYRLYVIDVAGNEASAQNPTAVPNGTLVGPDGPGTKYFRDTNFNSGRWSGGSTPQENNLGWLICPTASDEVVFTVTMLERENADPEFPAPAPAVPHRTSGGVIFLGRAEPHPLSRAETINRLCGGTSPPDVPPPTGCEEAGINQIAGTPNKDVIIGKAGRDNIEAGGGDDAADGVGGDDCVLGEAGDDALRGGPGRDGLSGGPGDDRLNGGGDADGVDGGPGADLVIGGNHDDTLVGGDGNDLLSDGLGRNTFLAGAGDDVVSARRKNVSEIIDCGPGNDLAIVDTSDKVKNCETVERPPKGPKKLPGSGVTATASAWPPVIGQWATHSKGRYWAWADTNSKFDPLTCYPADRQFMPAIAAAWAGGPGAGGPGKRWLRIEYRFLSFDPTGKSWATQWLAAKKAGTKTSNRLTHPNFWLYYAERFSIGQGVTNAVGEAFVQYRVSWYRERFGAPDEAKRTAWITLGNCTYSNFNSPTGY